MACPAPAVSVTELGPTNLIWLTPIAIVAACQNPGSVAGGQ